MTPWQEHVAGECDPRECPHCFEEVFSEFIDRKDQDDGKRTPSVPGK